MKNVYKAWKSTAIAAIYLVLLTVLKIMGQIESETYATLSAIAIPFMFTDVLKERKAID